ncbi:MAG: CapA family protein [candidate division WOR-3 bacterium]|nr:CapA family protein [candidate division WOR-3 bacterium]
MNFLLIFLFLNEIKIISVGDIFIHESVLKSVYQKENESYNFYFCFEEVEPYLKKVDIATCWFGGVLDTIGPYTGYPCFKTSTKILKKYNLIQIGAYISEEESKEIYIFEKDDIKISFLSYTYGTNGIPIPKPWMVNFIDLEKIKKDIEKAKRISDFVIVALHFGEEYERYPNKEQKRIVREIIKFGADMIIGSHPHVIQPVEMIEIDNKKVFVAYSLGNFFCGQRKRYTDTGIMLKYTIDKKENKIFLKEVSYLPCWIAKYKTKEGDKFKILPIKKSLKLYKEGKINYLSKENILRMEEALKETIEHIDNPKINFLCEDDY